jgi:PAS domain S-box-containing protein
MERERHHQSLSLREQQLIELAAAGRTDAEIAHELGISVGTVATYWGRIRSKFGGCSRTELVATALRETYERRISDLSAKTSDLAAQLERAAPVQSDQEGFCRAVLEAVPEPIVIVDPKCIIRFVNEASEELFGYSESEMVGQPISLLLPDRYHHVHRQHVAEYFQHPARRTMGPHLATPARHKLGREFGVLATLSYATTADGPIAVCVIQPMRSRADLSTQRATIQTTDTARQTPAKA